MTDKFEEIEQRLMDELKALQSEFTRKAQPIIRKLIELNASRPGRVVTVIMGSDEEALKAVLAGMKPQRLDS